MSRYKKLKTLHATRRKRFFMPSNIRPLLLLAIQSLFSFVLVHQYVWEEGLDAEGS